MAVTINASTSSGLVQSADNSGQIELQTNGTTVATVNTSNNVKFKSSISVGDATPTTSGAGITFPATQSASTDANTLDDYEEGTWTPTALGQTSAGTTTYSGSNTGYYIKTGRFVFLKGTISITAMTGTGNLRIGGLPFTQMSSDSGMGFIMTDGLDLPATGNMTLYVNANETSARIFVSTDNAAWQVVQCQNATWDMHFTFLMSASS